MSIWLTPAARDRLQQELDALRRCLDTSTEDDPNAIAVRRAQQGRIQQIHEMLVDAVVGEDPPNDGVAEPGMVVTVRFDDGHDVETFLLGVREADYGYIEVYSTASPLGAAITGARPGERRSYALPSGTLQGVTLVEAVPFGLHAGAHT